MSCAWTVFYSWMNDEKTGIGVRMPAAPDQPVAPGRLARREFEYVRNGTVDLLAGFRVNDGQVYGVVRPQHRSREFCELLDLLDTRTPAEQVIHLIVDPVSLHRSAEVATWLASRPQRSFEFHFLPIHSTKVAGRHASNQLRLRSLGGSLVCDLE
jgi:hypothetical protein